MIRHTVLFSWSDDATEEQKKRAADEMAKLLSLVPTVRTFVSGADAGINQGNFDFTVTADFDDVAGFVAYRDNPGHRAIIEEHILPILAKHAAVQLEF
jgi:hypothetical protein